MVLLENIWLILFFVWGLPLTFYRSKFRKIVYKTESCLYPARSERKSI